MGVLGLEGQPPCQHLVEDHADAVDIGGRGRGFTGRLLRREVVGGSPDRIRLLRRDGRVGAGNAKVGDLDHPLLGDQDVLGLQVAMDETVTVGVAHTSTNLEGDLHG